MLIKLSLEPTTYAWPYGNEDVEEALSTVVRLTN